MKPRILVFSLAVGMTLLTMTSLTSVTAFAQQPAQPAQQPGQPQPSQPAPAQTPQPAQQTPGQPLPTQTPSQPAPQQAPAQPAPGPALLEPQPQTTGPTMTIEGAVTNVVAYSCGSSTAAAAIKTEPVTSTTPPGMPAGTPTSSVSAAEPRSTGQGCSAVLLVTPGVNWAQVAHSEFTDQPETAGGLAGFGVPVTVVVKSSTTMTTRDNADLSLLDLPKGSIVRVEYAVRNDVPIATSIDVTWHAGQ